MTTASICTIGDEILIGQIVDTNSSMISRRLNAIGVRVTRMLSIGDDREQIITNLRNELRINPIVIVTGGLGPTKDDITKPALAELSGSTEWREDKEQLEVLTSILHSRGLDVLDINRAQAMVPDKCKVIVNRKGTAPIMVFHFAPDSSTAAIPAMSAVADPTAISAPDSSTADSQTTSYADSQTSSSGSVASSFDVPHFCALYSMPGVPYETESALDDVIEDIRAHFQTTDIFHRTLMTFGLAESALSKKIETWEDALPSDMHLAYLPNMLTGVRLRLSIYGGVREEQEQRIEKELVKLKDIIGDYIYSDQDDTLPNVIARILQSTNKTLSVAESCTGGRIASLFTAMPGCSEYFWGSVTSYDNSVKMNVLEVPSSIIAKYGAVSSECVAAMADGVRRITGTDFSVATSGIAGPGGGTEEKPVGTVWIGVSSARGTETFLFNYKNDRTRNIERFSATALNCLRKKILHELNL